MDLRLYSDRVMCLAGPSQSGKTSFVIELLKMKDELFRSPIQSIKWCYGISDAALHTCLRQRGYELQPGIPKEKDIKPNSICVLDDLLNESQNSKDVTAMFTRLAHHLPCFIIFISQNIFPGGKEARTQSVNTHYYVIFKNPRDKLQFQTFARQIYPSQSKAITEVFENATSNAHGYLFLDFTQECPEEFRIRSDIFGETPIIYRLF